MGAMVFAAGCSWKRTEDAGLVIQMEGIPFFLFSEFPCCE
jgi:hypothetical protein